MTTQQNKPIEPVKTSEGSLHTKAKDTPRFVCDSFDVWHISEFGGNPTHGSWLCDRERKAWHARDAEVLALSARIAKLEGVLKLCEESIEASDLYHGWLMTKQEVALSSIRSVLENKEGI